ncbi:MAG: hypothetical protein REI09_08160 [Candidatus Dactylopiibacterium sp.]|nr:hypothetical protein [Candidatus Dactylopiibacterium sp.]
MSLIVRCLVACVASIGFLAITSLDGGTAAPVAPGAAQPTLTNTAMAGQAVKPR